MSGLLNSASAISAALRIDSAVPPALPCADSGRISATFTWPAPTALGCAGGGGGAEPKLK
jgi:hypothetical protein